jgi:hypothetical protein
MGAVLKTNNLHLLHGERFHLEAFSQGKNNLAALLQVSIPENWPQFPEAFALGDTREVNLLSKDWSGFFFSHCEAFWGLLNWVEGVVYCSRQHDYHLTLNSIPQATCQNVFGRY